MIRILLPVDDSTDSSQAISAFLKRLDWYRDLPELHLLNVQMSLRGDISGFLKPELVDQYHRDEGLKSVEPARKLVEAAGIQAMVHVVVGPVAETIVRFAVDHNCDQIAMGSRGLGSVGGWILGSTVTRVLHQSTVPVLILR